VSLRIYVAICTHNRYDLLRGAIASVVPHLVDGRRMLLVVDNSYDPEAAAAFAREYEALPGIAFCYESVAGISNARNAALARCADDDVVAFLDDDARPRAGWLDALEAAFSESLPPPDAVGGPVEPQWPGAKPAWIHDEALSYLSVVDLGRERRMLDGREWLAGTNIAFRVGPIRALGGFDTRLGRIGPSALLSNEDIDAQQRLRAAGGRVLYEPAATVTHVIDPERLTQAWFRRRVAWQAISNFTVDPARVEADAARAGQGIGNFLKALPPGERTLAALAADVPTSSLFRLQLRANYLLQCSLLAGSGVPAVAVAPGTSEPGG